MLALFVRLTLAIAAVIVALMLLAILVKVAVVAVILAGIAFGALFIYNFFRALVRQRNGALIP